jgi:glycosyltransferase involved in cell wall biosynthesis
MFKNVYIIIPVYNEAKIIRQVIEDTLVVFPNIICVDDGSSDASASIISQTKARLVKHPVNIGQGGAIQTGLEYALRDPAAEYFVTFDADGQHRISDAKRMVDEIQKNDYDILLGSRFLGASKNIPKLKKIILTLATKFTNYISRTRLTDTHNGLRVFNRKFAEQLDITMADMTHGTEIILIIGKSGMRYKELPVTIDYTEYSKAKGQSILNSINILFDVLLSYNKMRKP